jgi:glycosyltransferase involved in cell wall biosynthesis
MNRQPHSSNQALPSRVLMTADTVGGVWNYSLELCRAFAGFDIEVALATMGAPLSTAQASEAAGLSNTRVFHSQYKLEWMESPWSDVAAAGSWLLDLASHVQAELIHFNGYAHASLPWEVPTIVVAHSCVLSWWQAVKGEPAPARWTLYRDAVRSGLSAADLVIAPSRAMLKSLQEHYGPLANTRVIPNCRKILVGPSEPKDELILSAGRLWDEAKNIAILNTIAPSLPWPVCIAGDARDPSERARLGRSNGRPPLSANDCETQQPAAATDTGPSRQMRYLGQLTSIEMTVWLNRAAIYVLPARYEPFGLSILEAALAGCALVLGDIPSLREIWADAAIFVPPDDRNALKDALELLIADNEMREALARKSLRRASAFTPERMANSYLAAYSQLLSQRGQPGPRKPGKQEELPCVL